MHASCSIHGLSENQPPTTRLGTYYMVANVTSPFLVPFTVHMLCARGFVVCIIGSAMS